MKVLLIVPTYHYNHHYPAFMPVMIFPTGYAYLASSLKEAGHEVYGLNLNNITGYPSARAMIEDKITRKIKEVEPDLVGIGGLCIDYLFIKDAIKIIRDKSHAGIVIGGGIVTNDAEYIFNLLKPDFCVIGEAEEAVVNIANGNYNTPNIGYWDNGVARFTQQDFNYKDINLLPFPDYEPFDMDSMSGDYMLVAGFIYRYTRPYPNPYILHFSRHCVFSCSFCIHHRGPKYRMRSVENAMQEIKLAYDKYHFNILLVMDELFAVNKVKLREFCNALMEAREKYGWNFDWSFSTHASARLGKEDLELAKKTGCSFYSLGVESSSPTVLKSMNKKTHPAQIAEAIRLAHEVKLSFGANYIFGDPAETEETVLETIDFLVEHCMDTNIVLNAIRPYPGSKIFDGCIERGLIKDKFDYYEHIDERPWDMSCNMTQMPTKRWLPLLDTMIAFGQLLPWVKSTIPYKYEVDCESAHSPIVCQSGKKVYKVWAKCPHCGADMFCRELLMIEKPKSGGKASLGDIKLVKDAVIKAIRLFTIYYLSFTNPIYKKLRSSVRNKGNLLWDSFFGTVFFATACTECHRKVKVTIPTPFTIKTLSLGEIKRRLMVSE